MQKLPVGIQSFADLRSNDYLYVDKTPFMHKLMSSGKVFFLSRPRRFGKSLLVSTLEALFKGDKFLFEGLYIHDAYDWEEHYPVIKLDWSVIKHTTEAEMEKGLMVFLKQIAGEYQITLKQEYAVNCLSELLWGLHRKTSRQAVVLVDEYDLPILDALREPAEKIEAIQDFLQSFYRVLKAEDEHLRFVFLTGVSKFSKVSLFSGLNNLRDISLDTDYAAVCGYTQEELERYFEPYIGSFAQSEPVSGEEILKQIRQWYNGFSWDGRSFVYNPFSTLLLFSSRVFKNYWFDTGTPTFLVNLIKERNEVKLLLEPCQMQDTEFSSFDYAALSTKLLMFQTGYLTIKQINKSRFGTQLLYTLGVPNEEVRLSLMVHLVSSFAIYPVSNTATMRDSMLGQLFDGDIRAFEQSMRELFAHIPYQLHIPREAYYHSLFLLWLNLLGFNIQAEVATDKGRIDAVWTWEDRVVIAEIKYVLAGTVEPLLDEALNQIRERRYHERYAASHPRIALLAIAFAGKDAACRMTELHTHCPTS
jgi:hypothetical protein